MKGRREQQRIVKGAELSKGELKSNRRHQIASPGSEAQHQPRQWKTQIPLYCNAVQSLMLKDSKHFPNTDWSVTVPSRQHLLQVQPLTSEAATVCRTEGLLQNWGFASPLSTASLLHGQAATQSRLAHRSNHRVCHICFLPGQAVPDVVRTTCHPVNYN